MGNSRNAVFGLSAMLLVSACSGGSMDWDLRRGAGALDTSDAALQATGPRPAADGRGVISYPGYQVAVARRGDTVGSVATRVGLSANELASYNALQPGDSLREGEVLALPSRVAAAPAAGGVIGGGASPGAIDVSTIATTALDRVGSTTPAPPAAAAPTAAKTIGGASGMEPTRHQVARGETAFSIARSYNVSAKALADWNGLGADLSVREGQYLMIPTPTGAPPARETVAEVAPGTGTPTPTPPSAKAPLPDEKVAPAAEVAKAKPPAEDLGSQRTTAAKFAMPVQGKIIRGYAKGRNDGIDIAAAPGTPVKAAADGSVAAVTKDTTGTPIVVLRHADGLLTVYAGVDGLKVAKGDSVKKGQTIAAVRQADPSFVHFEVRKGVDSLDPLPYVQ
ncbi:peptidoglycan DD-metalloendopeptidase family protein [Tabrizicola sp.]|uniref:peptidoglycan DD-metalloendopeptidase family protein n=1 Tax=Tabrizicola sp. TaxID=2005166 RepID=UPI003D28053E